jgi:hypothetical protein
MIRENRKCSRCARVAAFPFAMCECCRENRRLWAEKHRETMCADCNTTTPLFRCDDCTEKRRVA